MFKIEDFRYYFILSFQTDLTTSEDDKIIRNIAGKLALRIHIFYY